jgi:hypothetical protein
MKRSHAIKNEKTRKVPLAPFTLTILADPATGQVRWGLINLSPVPYPLIYQALELCRDNFKLQEANARAAKVPTPEVTIDKDKG